MQNKLSKKELKYLQFNNTSFDNMELDTNIKYNYIIAINSIPFMDKTQLNPLFENLTKHSSKNCIYAITFFSNKSTYVKKKSCFGMTKASILKLCKLYKLEIQLLENTHSMRKDGVVFDIWQFIALFKP